MQVEVLRKGSLGIEGTWENINCHATELRDIVKDLEELIEKKKRKLKFSKWRQGHNVHVFETHDGRKFALRPMRVKGEGYVGIGLYLRQSRSQETFLMTLYADGRNGMKALRFFNVLRHLSEVPPCLETGKEEMN